MTGSMNWGAVGWMWLGIGGLALWSTMLYCSIMACSHAWEKIDRGNRTLKDQIRFALWIAVLIAAIMVPLSLMAAFTPS